MDYKIVSADSHVDLGFLPWDLFANEAPSEWKDKMPRVVQKDGKNQWWIGDVYIEDVGHYGDTEIYNPGMKDRVAKMSKVGFLEDSAKGDYHPTNLDLRLKDQDLDGVQAEVIYGLFAVATKLKDQEQVAAIYRIYNDWMADFTSKNPNRLAGLACIPNHDPKAAAAEVRRAAAMGLRGIEFGSSTAVKPVYDRDWDVLWAAADECDMPISFHTTGFIARRPNEADQKKYAEMHLTITITLFQLSGAEVLSSIIFSGACERFPNVRFVLGECGVTWIPYVIDRMDHEGQGAPGLVLKPSDYWKRQGYSTFQKEGFAGDMIDFIGPDNVMWGSDYPHPDGVWPDSLEAIANNFRNLPDKSKLQKIICDTAVNLYKFN